MAGEKRPSLLMTADTVGGVWTYAVELAHALTQRGLRVHLATMGAPVREHQRAQLAAVPGVTLHESEYALEWMPEPWSDVDRAGAWLLSLERTLRPDLVHLNQFAFGALPFRAPKLVVAHSCVLSWWRAAHGESAPPSWDRYRDVVRDGLNGADLVAAPTRAMLQTLGPNYGFGKAGTVLPNARDARRFAPVDKQPYVFAAGRFWDEAKNLAALEAVAPQLPWPVRVAGSCARPDGRIVQPAHVQFVGELAQDKVARQLAAASIYALPARYEPFGLSVLEAALAGCALVLGDIPSLREVWGSAALYVRPDDTIALGNTLRHLMGDEEERLHLGAAARARAAHFSPARMADAYLQAYGAIQPLFQPQREEDAQCVS